MSARCTASLGLFVMLAPWCAMAEEASDAGSEVDSFSTTVRAERQPQSAAETTINREVLDAVPRESASDLLRAVPGMVATQHSGAGKAHQLFLRGFDALHGQDVEVNVAGLPVNVVSHIHAQGYADLNWLIPEVVHRIRVTEGTYRASQGDFAIAGSVRFDLGLEHKGLLAKTTLGSFGAKRLLLAYQPSDDAGTFAAGDISMSEGFGPERAASHYSVLAQVSLPVSSANVKWLAGSYAGRFQSPGVLREDEFQRGERHFFSASFPHQGGLSSRHQLLSTLEMPLQNGKLLFEVGGLVATDFLRNNFTGYFSDARGDGLEQSHQVTTLFARLTGTRRFTLAGHSLTLELGLTGRRDAATQTQRAYRETDVTPYRDDVNADFTVSSGALTAEGIWKVGGWTFLLGGRGDMLTFDVDDRIAFLNPRFYDGTGYRRSAQGTHWGLKVGVSRALGERLRLFINYGDGFRSPEARSLADREQAPFINVRGADLGVGFTSTAVALNTSVFGSYVADDSFFDASEGTSRFTGPTLRAGVSASLTARPVRQWLISASGTLATAQMMQTRVLLPYFAPGVGRFESAWEQPFSLWGFTAQGRFGAAVTLIGARPLPFGDYSQTVVLADLLAAVSVGAIGFNVDIQNLLDTRWRDSEFVFASASTAGGATPQLPARQFSAGSPRIFLFSLEVRL